MTIDMVCVIPFRLDEDGLKILVLLRNPADGLGNNFWQMVSGTHPEDEWSPITALREVEEETGLRPLKLYEVDAIHRIWLRRQDIIIHGPVFAAELAAGEVVISNEHIGHEWLPASEALIRLPRDSQRTVLRRFLNDIVDERRYDEFLMWSHSGGWTRFKPPVGPIDRGY